MIMQHIFVTCLFLAQSFLPLDANGLGDLAKILAALSGEVECSFKCPSGSKPVVNKRHVPTSNGCGSHGLQLDTSEMPGFTDCCDIHDKCYDTCNKDRKECDEDFKSCLGNVCLFEGLSQNKPKSKMKKCQASADMMYATTSTLGCSAYVQSQANACLCDGRKLTKQEIDKLFEKKEEL